MILKIFTGLFAAAAIGFVLLAHAGDNPDARALASMFYFPAAACGLVDLVLLYFVFR